jgi:hypothetical protein
LCSAIKQEGQKTRARKNSSTYIQPDQLHGKGTFANLLALGSPPLRFPQTFHGNRHLHENECGPRQLANRDAEQIRSLILQNQSRFMFMAARNPDTVYIV